MTATYQLTIPLISQLLPRRALTAHKGEVGHLLVLAGSYGLTGAATLSSRSALKAGCGTVVLGTPTGAAPFLDFQNTEVMTEGLSETKEGSLHFTSFNQIKSLIKKKNAVAIGPGLSSHPSTQKLLKQLFIFLEKRIRFLPTVIDADGLSAIKRRSRKVKKSRWGVLTPHLGELARMLHLSTDVIKKDGIQRWGMEAARIFQKIVVVKGHPTYICTPDGEVYVSRVGNPGMATAGSGDVLTGVIGSFLAQGLKPLPSALAGVFVHGFAGDLARENKGEAGLIASDILECIPLAIKRLTGR